MYRIVEKNITVLDLRASLSVKCFKITEILVPSWNKPKVNQEEMWPTEELGPASPFSPTA
jgi:hypothetical protein